MAATKQNHITLTADKLVISDENARKKASDPKKDLELKKSILQIGLLQNLVVSSVNGNGVHEIHAGGRRFKAISELIADKKIDADYPILCLLEADETTIAEASLAENMIRADMHPADEFAAMRRLQAEKGLTIDQLADHFGKPKNQVKKLLALGSVSPKILDLSRSGKISPEALQAFTVTTDHEAQESAYRTASKQEGHIAEFRIRRILTEGTITTANKDAKFISLTDYKKRGGRTSADLFESEIYILDPHLVAELVAERVEKIILQEGADWQFVEFVPVDNPTSYNSEIGEKGTVKGAPAQLKKDLKKAEALITELNESEEDEIEGLDIYEAEEQLEEIQIKLNSFRIHTKAEKAKSGVIVAIAADGSPAIYRGITRGQAEEPGQQQSPGQAGDAQSPPSKAAPGFSAALRQDLNVYKTDVGRLALGSIPELAIGLVSFVIVSEVLGISSFKLPNVDVRGHKHLPETSLQDRTSHNSGAYFDRDLEAIKREPWFKEFEAGPPHCYGVIETFLLQGDELVKQAAKAIAATLDPVSSNGLIDILIGAADLSIRDYWTPTAENYFKRVNIEQLHKDAEELATDAELSNLIKLQKKDLAIRLEEIAESDAGAAWLPEPMRVSGNSPSLDAEAIYSLGLNTGESSAGALD